MYPGHEEEWDDGTQNWHYMEAETRTCQRVHPNMFQQDKIWIDSKKRVILVTQLEDGHLDNLIAWIKQHADHWQGKAVLLSPLMRALEAEQKRRIPKRNTTPRAALKDTLLNDVVLMGKVAPRPDVLVARIIGGLHARGYEIRKVKS